MGGGGAYSYWEGEEVVHIAIGGGEEVVHRAIGGEEEVVHRAIGGGRRWCIAIGLGRRWCIELLGWGGGGA